MAKAGRQVLNLPQVTGAVGWRKDGIKYKKNEVYLDIIEEVNLMMSSKGQVLRSDVNGKVVMKIFLSGMPDVKLGLNEKLDVSSAGNAPSLLYTFYRFSILHLVA